MTFEFLEKPVGTMDLLLLLRTCGPVGSSEALEKLGASSETFYNAVERLRSLGYLFEEKESGFPVRVRYGLTKRGEAVANCLSPLADEMRKTEAILEQQMESLEKDGGEAGLRRRLEILGVLAQDSFARGLWERTLSYTARLLDIARRLSDKSSEVSSMILEATIHMYRNDLDDSMRLLQSTRKIADENGLLSEASEVARIHGLLSERLGKMEEARALYDEALRLAESAADAKRALRAKMNIGGLLWATGHYDSSFSAYTDVIAALESMDDQEYLPKAYYIQALNIAAMKRPEAEECFRKAVSAALRQGDIQTEAYALISLACRLADKGKFRQAGLCLERARSISENLGELFTVCKVDHNAAIFLAMQSRWSESEEKFESALRMARETKNQRNEAKILKNWGEMEKNRNRPEKAKTLLLQAMELFREAGDGNGASECEEILSPK